ncbi:MAG: insulinase family protein [Candidatus Omnitrophica bacterium]|nr:insulinase family protein [Candidatus Omnitrophota bacterium]
MHTMNTLPNGIRVSSSVMTERSSASIGVWIGCGGRYEKKHEAGISHFLEHMLFKGTKRRGCEELKRTIEGMGGSFNGFTAEEFTCYLVKVPAEGLRLSVDVLTDMVFSPKLSVEELEKERHVIIEEIKMYQDMPISLVEDNLQQLMWPKNPLGQLLTGTPETVSAINRKALTAAHRTCYVPNNISVVGCGALDQMHLEEIIGQFTECHQPSVLQPFKKAVTIQNKPAMFLQRKETEQTRIALGFHAIPRTSPHAIASNLLNIILGGNMSSRLFHEVREKRGLVYDIHSSCKKFSDTGMFVISAGTEQKLASKTIRVILHELEKIKKDNIAQRELKRAKEYYIGQMKLSLENTMDRMIWLGEKIITNTQVEEPNDVFKKIARITAEELTELARDIFAFNKRNLSVVGNVTDQGETNIRKTLEYA